MTGGQGFSFGAKYAIGIVTYFQFILEETVQTGLMGCYIADNNGHISVMDKVVDRLERVTLPQLHDFNKLYGYLAFFNQNAFDAFWKTGKIAVEVYKECKDKEEVKWKSKPSSAPPMGFRGPMTKTPSRIYPKNEVTITAKFASEIDSSAETEAIDIVWLKDGLEVKNEQVSALSWKKERDVTFTTTFPKPGKYKIECVACKPGSYGLSEEELNYLINPSLDPESPIMLVDKIKKDPSPAYTGDNVTFTTNYKAVKYSTIPTGEADIAWLINNKEVKRERYFGLPQEKQAKAEITQLFPIEEKVYIKCKVLKPNTIGETPLHQKNSTLNIKPLIACVNFTDKIKKDISPVYTNLITTFSTKFASTRDHENETEPLDILWLVNGEEARRHTLTALARMQEQEVNYYITFHDPGKYKLDCVLCTPGTYIPIKIPKAYINFTKRINKDHAPVYVNETITLSTKFAYTKDQDTETEAMDFVWTIDDVEVKRETLTALANMQEREITFTKLFNEPGKYKIKVMTVDPGDPVCHPFDTASYTVTVYPTMAAVKFDGKITKEPEKAYLNEEVTFKLKYLNTLDIPDITEEMDFIWTIDDVEVKRETLAALAHMGKKEITISKTFDNYNDHKIECKCEGDYFDELHTIDEASHTAKIYPLMETVEFIADITREPTPAYSSDLIYLYTKFAAGIDSNSETEAMDFIWTIDDVEVKRETLAALAHMAEQEITLSKIFDDYGEHKIKCKCEGYYFDKTHVLDEVNYTLPVLPFMTSVQFTTAITREVSPIYVNDNVRFTIKFGSIIDQAVETEAMNLIWTIDDVEVKRETLTALAHMADREIFIDATFEQSESHNVKCKCVGSYFDELHTIDEASHTAKVYPYVESVGITESVIQDPSPAYVNDLLTYTAKIAAGIDRDVATEQLDVVWEVDGVEEKRETITAPANMAEQEVTFERTFTESEQYAVKCRCEATYLDELHVLDEKTKTTTVYPLVAAVDIAGSIIPDPTKAYINDQVTFTANVANTIDRDVETEQLDVVWEVDGVEEKRETITAPANMAEQEVTFEKMFTESEQYAVKCHCEATYLNELNVIDEKTKTTTVYPYVESVGITESVIQDPSPAYVNDLLTYTAKVAAGIDRDVATEQLDVVWTVDGVEETRETITALAQMAEQEVIFEKAFSISEQYAVKCHCEATYLDELHVIDEKTKTTTVYPLVAAVDIIGSITADPTKAYINDHVTFTANVANTIDRDVVTEELDVVWTVDDVEETRETIIAPANMAEQEVTFGKTFSMSEQYAVKCHCEATYLDELHTLDEALHTAKVYPYVESVGITESVIQDPSPAYVNDLLTYTAKIAAGIDRDVITEELDVVWEVDGVEEKRETINALAHMAEQEVTFERAFSESEQYAVKCRCEATYLSELHTLDEKTKTTTVYPLVAAVDIAGSIIPDPTKAYINDQITYTANVANTIDRDVATEQLDVVWEVDGVEAKRETITAPANMAEQEVTFERTFTESEQYAVKCRCEATYLDELHTIDEASKTTKVYPYVESVGITESIIQDPSPAYVNDLLTYTAKIAAGIDRDVVTEQLDVVWEVDGVEEKRETITAPANMAEQEVTFERTFSISEQYAVKCRCEATYLSELHTLDEKTKTTTVYPLVAAVDIIGSIIADPTKAYVNDLLTYTAKVAAGIDRAVATEALDVVWTVDGVEAKRETITAPAHKAEQEVTFGKTFNVSEQYAVKCRCEATYLGSLHIIDEASKTATVYPLVESVDIVGSITADPTKAYINDHVAYTAKVAAGIDRAIATEAMDVVWTVDEVEAKRETITAPANMAERSVTFGRTFNVSEQYAVKCRCEATYLGSLHIIDEASQTEKVYPYVESVDFTQSISKDPSPAYVYNTVTFKIKFAAGIDRAVATEAMDVVWTIDDVEIKRETKTALAHMAEREVAMQKAFSIAKQYNIKCRCEATYFGSLHTIDEASYTVTIHET